MLIMFDASVFDPSCGSARLANVLSYCCRGDSHYYVVLVWRFGVVGRIQPFLVCYLVEQR